jgi:hypothetical protein
LPLGTISALVEPFENRLVAAVALLLSALGLRVSLLDFFCPLAMLVAFSKVRNVPRLRSKSAGGDTFMAKAILPWP